jgi:hypothetical protein
MINFAERPIAGFLERGEAGNRVALDGALSIAVPVPEITNKKGEIFRSWPISKKMISVCRGITLAAGISFLAAIFLGAPSHAATAGEIDVPDCQRECNNVPEMGMKSVPPW